MIKILVAILLSITSVAAQNDWTDKIELINQEKINTEHTEFSPAYWNEYIVFVASRPRAKLFDPNTRDAYYDLYYAAGSEPGTLSKVALLSKNINTPTHEGPISFDPINNSIYYSSLEVDSDNISRNKIFKSDFLNSEWQKGALSELNFDQTAACHPSIDPTGQTIYFASDRPGGFGKMDLYSSTLIDGQWSEAKNLGPSINTADNEIYPFVSERNFLFFASDDNLKKNGLDVFMSQINDQNPSDRLRLPAPINSPYDDFGVIIKRTGKSGYFSSNRPNGKGKDDIYYFESNTSLYAYQNDNYNVVNCIIKDTAKVAISNCTIKYRSLLESDMKAIDPSVFSFENKVYETKYSDGSGLAFIKLEKKYTLVEVSSDGKEPWQKILSNDENYGELLIILEDTKKPEILVQEEEVTKPIATINNVALDVGAVLVFNNIYYDYNSDEIKKGAANELDQLATIMKDNPALKIQLSAHTDSRGKEAYNQVLSERRAIAAKNYMLQKGIPSHKIITIGFGESKPRNHCKDGINCTEAEHVYNRRTEVTILEK